MDYNLEEYSERSRRWSVLKHLSGTVFADRTDMVFAPEAEDSSYYHVRWPRGIPNRPAVAFEYMSGSPSAKGKGVGGALEWRGLYQLTVIAGILETTGILRLSEELLDVWLMRLRKQHGIKVPFYDFRVPGSPVRNAGYDFVLSYVSDRRDGEKIDQDKNLLVVQWQVEG